MNDWMLFDSTCVEAQQEAWLERLAQPQFYAAQTAQDWQEHAAHVRRHVLDCLGLLPLPERVDLDLQTVAVREHDQYVMQRIYWQSFPGYYASGWLYMPREITEPLPGVLCPHGHWENGARHPVVQSRCIALAKLGYVALAVDSVHTFHWAAGMVPLTVMTWNNIRGIDLLCSIPQVDASRLGCTGCSGGAQQTFYLMALEDRLTSVVPVAMVSQWRRILFTTWTHCHCNHIPSIFDGTTDTPELAACFTPRPAKILSVTEDWTAWLPKEGFPQIKRVYELFDAGENVRNYHRDWFHDYNQPMRESMYAWFNRTLKDAEPSEIVQEPEVAPETLDYMLSVEGPSEQLKNSSFVLADILARTAAKWDIAAEPANLQQIRANFKRWAHEVEPLSDVQAAVLKTDYAVDGLEIKGVSLSVEADIHLPMLVVNGAECVSNAESVILVDAAGKAVVMEQRSELVKQLAQAGYTVGIPDVRPFGEMSLNREAQQLNGTVFGRCELALTAHDISQVAKYLRDLTGKPQVTVIAWGDGAVAGIGAGLIDEKLTSLIAIELGENYLESDRLPRAPKILTVGDLPQLAGAWAPRPVWIEGMRPVESWHWTREAYQKLEQVQALRLSTGSVDIDELLHWLQNVS
jgi:hypothetical protein